MHISGDPNYRTPFGAAAKGGPIRLSIDVSGDMPQAVELRLWREDEGEELVPMSLWESAEEGMRYTATIEPDETGIIWYSFNITASDGAVWRYGAAEEHAVGEGAFAFGDPPSFQITVYEPRETQPTWWQNGVCYQVFPDRFARGADWEERAATLKKPRKGPKRKLVKNWSEAPSYKRKKDGSIAQWDFYGGTLEGVREKLGYLEELGVTCIYLNPIFEAASNHRYDTADFLKIDPALGDTESFTRLCDEAHARGMHVILDGVFNHTGRDSRYFNAFGNYPEVGAAQSEKSPYRSWYKLKDDGSYSSWWGIADLPDVEETDPSYQEFICGENGVLRTWMRAGADGWRLDVADELPDSFIVKIKEAVLAEKPDGLVIGEVWEDATTKYAYDELRQYFQGAELDGVMNYPFRAGLLDYLTGEATAPEFARTLAQLGEHYPREALASCMNLIGSHDRERVLTVLGGAPAADELTDEECAERRLTDNERSLAVSRYWVASLIQMCMPGVPSIYYGDEAGLEGYRDPYNRATYPWGAENRDCFNITRNAIALRKTLPVLVSGDFEPFALNDDVFGFWRTNGDECVCVLANASLESSHAVRIPARGPQVVDVVSGCGVEVAEGECEIFLWPLGTSVLHFHAHERLQKPLEPGTGVIAHVTSVPGAGGRRGTIQDGADFIDWLHEAGARYWQILPINPTDQYGSPYAGLSAFAGHTELVLASDEERRLAEKSIKEGSDFVARNADWLEPYAAFCAIKDMMGEGPWWEWPAKYRRYDRKLLRDKELAPRVRHHMAEQLLFEWEWDSLRRYASDNDIQIIGDMPMYVSADSSDVWAHPELFAFDADAGVPTLVAGAPGDHLAPEGQVWGNPCYRWDEHARTGYAWWLRRLERAFELYDVVRLDHFIGFSSYYGIPYGESAAAGSWRFGPGAELFRAARKRFGQLPLLAEDLGTITPAVRALVAEVGAPGMSVVQFADEDVREAFHPSTDTVAYLSTHDTSTLLGWVERNFALEGAEARELADKIAAHALVSNADVVMMQLQDVLGLGDEARMNVPGVAEGNWSWQAEEGSLTPASQRLASFVRARG